MTIQPAPALLWEFSVGATEYVLRCTADENPKDTFTMVVTENGTEVLREVITMSVGAEGWRIPYQYAVELVNHFRARAIEKMRPMISKEIEARAKKLVDDASGPAGFWKEISPDPWPPVRVF
jgi:hypothetical protein